MEQLIAKRAERAISEKIFPGCVVGIVCKNGDRKVLPFGKFTYEEKSNKVREDTIYDVASITKPIPTASLALKLIAEGKLNKFDKVIKYIPELRHSHRENVLIKHLLTYTMALEGPTLSSFREKSADEVMDYMFSQELADEPGRAFKYSNLPFALLGMVIERITSKTLDVLADDIFFHPLGMNDTTFFPEKFAKDIIAPTEIDDWRGLVQGVVHDESAYLFKTKANKVMGHAGIFSTAPDILNFLEMLLNNGQLGGKKYFSHEIINEISTNQIAEIGSCTGLGWELNQPRFMGAKCGERTFGKTGFTGTLCVCDIEREVALVVLSNRTFPKRSADSAGMNSFRADIADIIFEFYERN